LKGYFLMNALAPTPAYFNPSLAQTTIAQPMASPVLYSIPAPAMANTTLTVDTFQRSQPIGQTSSTAQTTQGLGFAESAMVGIVAPAMQATDNILGLINSKLKGSN
jgi:hypothetical protein